MLVLDADQVALLCENATGVRPFVRGDLVVHRYRLKASPMLVMNDQIVGLPFCRTTWFVRVCHDIIDVFDPVTGRRPLFDWHLVAIGHVAAFDEDDPSVAIAAATRDALARLGDTNG